MTIAELIETLKHLDNDRIVIMSRDPEGNGYSPLEDVDTGAYKDGEVESEEGLEGERAVILWPKY